ncbi:MAG: molybdopterin-dependent oxidoreductase, partial [Myxococcota bacterium]
LSNTGRRPIPVSDPCGGDREDGYAEGMAAEAHYRTCHLCEAMCGLKITLDGDRILRIEGDQKDPFSQGHICPKAVGIADIHEDADRLKMPVRRKGDRWMSISWEEAFDLVGEQIADLQDSFGRDAVATYWGNPIAHNYGSALHGQLLLRALSTKNNFSATSLDQLPHMLAAFEMFGNQLRLPVPDIDRTDLWVIIGANPVVSNGSIMSAGDVKSAIKKIQNRGGRVVVIDPRRTQTARLADEHIFIQPGTDAALLAAIVRHVIATDSVDMGPLADRIDGLPALTKAVEPFSIERAAATTGISPETIQQLADALIRAERAVLYGRVGLCTQPFGGLGAWLVNVINIITGRLDQPGGYMFPTPAVDLASLAGLLGRRGSFGRHVSRVHGLPEFGHEFPTPVLADEILTPGDGQIRGLIVNAGNPVLSCPGGERLDHALAQLDFMVAVDIYINETTRHADVILPPTFGLEHDHHDLVFHALAVRNSVKYSPAAWPKSEEQRHDWQIYSELARRIVSRRPSHGWRRLRQAALDPLLGWVARTEPARALDTLMRTGPHRLSLAKVKASPHGLDLGPLQPRLPDALETPGRRIPLAPLVFMEDMPRLIQRLETPAPALTLIGRRLLRSNNSWMHNSPRLTKGDTDCTLLMHPEDAQERGLNFGQMVRVSTDAGAVVVPLQSDEGLKRGVVCLPHGFGHQKIGVRLRVAEQVIGESSNDLIGPDLDPLSGVACLNDVSVEVGAVRDVH